MLTFSTPDTTSTEYHPRHLDPAPKVRVPQGGCVTRPAGSSTRLVDARAEPAPVHQPSGCHRRPCRRLFRVNLAPAVPCARNVPTPRCRIVPCWSAPMSHVAEHVAQPPTARTTGKASGSPALLTGATLPAITVRTHHQIPAERRTPTRIGPAPALQTRCVALSPPPDSPRWPPLTSGRHPSTPSAPRLTLVPSPPDPTPSASCHSWPTSPPSPACHARRRPCHCCRRTGLRPGATTAAPRSCERPRLRGEVVDAVDVLTFSTPPLDTTSTESASPLEPATLHQSLVSLRRARNMSRLAPVHRKAPAARRRTRPEIHQPPGRHRQRAGCCSRSTPPLLFPCCSPFPPRSW